MPDDPVDPVGTPPAVEPPAPIQPAADLPASVDPPAEPLGDAGKSALEAERKARREAEKRATAAEKANKEREDAELSENERLKKENEEGRVKIEAATAKARNANLLSALAEKGLVGAKGKAAIRLLDGVEFDDEDEPVNLDAAIEAAKATYGEVQFSAEPVPRRPAPNLNGGAGSQPGPEPQLTAEELEYARANSMTPQQYEEMKGVRTLADYEAAQRRLAATTQ